MIFKRKLWPVYKATTVQIGGKLIILDGHNPLRYIDLATNKVHTGSFIYKVASNNKIEDSKL